MMYFAVLTSGDRVTLTESEFEALKTRMVRAVNKNMPIKSGGLIRTTAVIYLGVEETTTTTTKELKAKK